MQSLARMYCILQKKTLRPKCCSNGDQAERKLSLNRRSSSSSRSTPAQQPRPLLAERGPRAQTAADVLVEEGAPHPGAPPAAHLHIQDSPVVAL